MHSGWVRSIAAWLPALLLPGAALAQSPNPRFPYALQKASEFQQGCFDPCSCPLLLAVPLEGEFALSFSGIDGTFQVYDVTAVSLFVPALGIRLEGEGLYRVRRGPGGEQRMTLDLSLDGGAPEIYDSGLVPAELPFPAIRTTVTIHDYFCYDRPLTLDARPRPIRLSILDSPEIALAWTETPDAAGYAILRGDLGSLRQGAGDFAGSDPVCLSSSTLPPWIEGGASPPTGGAWYFLVKAAESGDGTWDSGMSSQFRSRDASIAASGVECP